jgi:hypothetical protein
MSESPSSRGSWMLPVLLAVALTAAGGFAFLYFTRPNAGELGAIKVVVTDESGKAGNAITIHVAEAPLVQKNSVSPGQTFTGQVNFPEPYRIPPHLKVTPSGKRLYEVGAVTEFGFGWTARMLPDDVREDVRKEADAFDRVFGLGIVFAAAQSKLKPGLVFEDFAWEAQGLRMPASSLPPKTFEQSGKFYTLIGQEGPVSFPVPYASPPLVQLSGYNNATIVTEVTATGFRWRNPMKEPGGNQGDVTWTAKGVLGQAAGK